MSNPFSNHELAKSAPGLSAQKERWHTFEDILQRLHREGILLHPHQLAEFLLRHGLPVDHHYVPQHLQKMATRINDNYQGSMARLEAMHEPPWYSIFFDQSPQAH